MSFPFIVWCRQRTGSISLFNSLCSVSEHTPAEMEPFDFGGPADRQFTEVGKRMLPGDRDRSLRDICDRGLLIKHCYENLSEEFNHALAEISTRAEYLHIHLWRRDEIARLVSKGVAEQHGTWVPGEWTQSKHADWKSGNLRLPPLDVSALKEYHERCESRWKAVAVLLRAHEVTSEDLFSKPCVVLSGLANYIGFPQSCIHAMRNNLGSGQNTASVWNLIPNIEELRTAIGASNENPRLS